MDHMSFEVDQGEIAVLLGPNGQEEHHYKCIAGLPQYDGEITVGVM